MEAANAGNRRPLGGGARLGLWFSCCEVRALLNGDCCSSGWTPPCLITMLTKWVLHARLETRTKETCAVASVWANKTRARNESKGQFGCLRWETTP